MKIFHIILVHRSGQAEKIPAIARDEGDILLRAASLCLDRGAETFEVRARSDTRPMPDLVLGNFGLL